MLLINRSKFTAEIDKRSLPGEDIIAHPQNINSNMFLDTTSQNQSY